MDDLAHYSAMYKPFHLIGLELNILILAAALASRPTGMTKAFKADVLATAKRKLHAGEMIDGEGGHIVWGKLNPAQASMNMGGLPIGLARGVKLLKDIDVGESLSWADVAIDETLGVAIIRKETEAMNRH